MRHYTQHEWSLKQSSDALRQTIIRLLQSMNHPVHPITSDNDMEFSEHEAIASELHGGYTHSV